MANTDWIKNLAPLIGSALAGPLGGAAAGFLADKLGVKESTVEAVTDALTSQKMTGDQLVGIKAAEIEFQKFLETNKIDLVKLANEDRGGARDMLVATKSLTPSVLTYLITIGFFGILIGLMTGVADKSDALMVMLGSLGTAWTASCSFWFGSSHGSQNKDKMLANSSPTQS